MGTDTDPESARWKARRAAAVVLRLVVLLAPVAAAVAASFTLTRLIPTPATALARYALLAAIVVGCGFLAWPARSLLRRLLPLAALLEMSLLFPGEAPSRWQVAREASSIQHLEPLLTDLSDQQTSRAATTILALVASLARHDKLTCGHSNRVRVFADMIAVEMGMSEADRDRLRWAALIHDVGKLCVPARILCKPAKPTPAEWRILKSHPEAGAQLTAPLANWLGPFAAVVVEHHERYDGTGYPAGLKGHQISLGARIVTLADSFEVMTSARPYKRAMSRTAAMREVTRCSGTHFDPVVVRALLAVSLPRLRRALGPLSWLGQLPVVVTAPAASVSAVASGAARSAAILTGITGAVVAGTVGAAPAVVPESHFTDAVSTVPQDSGQPIQHQLSRGTPGPSDADQSPRPDTTSAPQATSSPDAGGGGPAVRPTVSPSPTSTSSGPASVPPTQPPSSGLPVPSASPTLPPILNPTPLPSLPIPTVLPLPSLLPLPTGVTDLVQQITNPLVAVLPQVSVGPLQLGGPGVSAPSPTPGPLTGTLSNLLSNLGLGGGTAHGS